MPLSILDTNPELQHLRDPLCATAGQKPDTAS